MSVIVLKFTTVNIYARKTWWKYLLAAAALVVVVVSLWYSNFLATNLKETEREKVEIFAIAMQELTNTEQPQQGLTAEGKAAVNDYLLNHLDRGLATAITETFVGDIPVIAVNDAGQISIAKNFGSKDNDLDYLYDELDKIKASGLPPITGGTGYATEVYYKNSKFLPYLTYFPLLQILLITAFVGTGYLGFSSSRKAEQNRVWVGMAKETAHQLGTPISALMGWIEHLKYVMQDDPDEEKELIITELTKDVDRLQLVADRFSKIGSDPEMHTVPVATLLRSVHDYMKSRTPKKVELQFPRAYKEDLMVRANAPLIEWVFENMIRNSIDAMAGKGHLKVEVYLDNNYVCVDFADTGKGIPSSKWKTVFEPGYTTKKRGWGLGLSLAKRIVNEYHRGKIFVKQSVINEGTTITVKLPDAHS